MEIAGKTGPGDKGLNAPLLAAVARHLFPVAQLVFVHPRQRIMPPLPGRAVATGVSVTVKGDPRPAAGADNHRENGLRPGGRAVDGL